MPAAAGALTTLPMWLQSLKLLPAVASGSDGEATNSPICLLTGARGHCRDRGHRSLLWHSRSQGHVGQRR